MILHDIVLKFASTANNSANICFFLLGNINSSLKRMLVHCIVEDEGHVLVNLEFFSQVSYVWCKKLVFSVRLGFDVFAWGHFGQLFLPWPHQTISSNEHYHKHCEFWKLWNYDIIDKSLYDYMLIIISIYCEICMQRALRMLYITDIDIDMQELKSRTCTWTYHVLQVPRLHVTRKRG